MTKRRAENILPPEIPNKRSFYSLDKPIVSENVIQNDNTSSLLSFAEQRCSKRQKCLEDPLDTDNLRRKVSANRVDSVLADKNTCRSRTFEDAGRSVMRRSTCELRTESNKQPDEENNLTAGDKVMHTDEDLSPFNSFQFWRVPLPALDFSLLETEPSARSSSTKELEAMET